MIESRMRTVAEDIAAAFDVGLTFSFTRIYPAFVNHAADAMLAGNVMRDLVGAANVDENMERMMTYEDFAFYLLHKPGACAFIGNGDGSARLPGQAGDLCQLHSASHDFNDALRPLGTSYWVALAHAYLNHPGAPA
jgi:metal-dependent amidase/aminoacylase/carboxypeptidase family protein